MKFGNPSNFHVHVVHQIREESADIAHHFQGIYEITLNHVLSIYVVPPFDWAPWPPVKPVNEDTIRSAVEARRIIAALGGLLITSDVEKAGNDERFEGWPRTEDDVLPCDEAGSNRKGVVFFLTPSELDKLSAELDVLADQFCSALDTIPISEIAPGPLKSLLLSRILVSPLMKASELRIVGRG